MGAETKLFLEAVEKRRADLGSRRGVTFSRIINFLFLFLGVPSKSGDFVSFPLVSFVLISFVSFHIGATYFVVTRINTVRVVVGGGVPLLGPTTRRGACSFSSCYHRPGVS